MAFVRERSSSNRNLPDTSKIRGTTQPRRASDEVAGSSSQRLMARISPAPSRRSISVMNVGDNYVRSSSKLGSASNLIKQAQMRRDSMQQQQQQAHQSPASGSPVTKYSQQSDDSPSRSRMAIDSSQAGTGGTAQVGITPSGRRSSLVGIQSMTGYRSQKNSHSATSDASDHSRSPVKSGASSSASLAQKRSQPVTPQQSNLADPVIKLGPKAQQHRASIVSVSPSQSSSRRGSTEQHPPLQRKGSFALLTLRKLKRTMSLTKGSDQEQSGSNQDSRQSSFSSSESSTNLAEDLGITRRIVAHTEFVGKLKLSFIMTKGQLEVEVISAQGLKFDHDSTLGKYRLDSSLRYLQVVSSSLMKLSFSISGLYVKMYLKGKNKSNKRKTRLVQPEEAPVFRQVIKYDGSLVDNKSLEVSVWQKQGGLRGKMPVGFTEIRLSELSLAQVQTSWYNLRSMESACSSSVED